MAHKFIREYSVTSASVHDSNVFEELLDPNNSSRDVWADSAYRSEDITNWLQSNSFREHLQRKGTRSRKLIRWEQPGTCFFDVSALCGPGQR